MVAFSLVLVGVVPGINSNNLAQISRSQMVNQDWLAVGGQVETSLFSILFQGMGNCDQLLTGHPALFLIEAGSQRSNIYPVAVASSKAGNPPAMLLLVEPDGDCQQCLDGCRRTGRKWQTERRNVADAYGVRR